MSARRAADVRPVRPVGLRRGATLVVVCVLLTTLVGFTALAVDLGRMYHTGVELQTAADAAALGAMRAHQYAVTLSVPEIERQAAWMASLNHAAGQGAEVLAEDVRPMTYTPSTRAITAAAWTTETGAIQVTAQARVRTIFAAAFGDSVYVMRRTATAWLANVNGGSCVRPFAIDYTRFYEEGVTWDSRYSSVGAKAPDFVHWDVASTQNSSMPGRTFIILPPGAKESSYEARGYTAHGNWRAADLLGGGLGAFTSQVAAATSGADCGTARATVGDTKTPLVADSASTLAAMNAGMRTLCHRMGNAPDAHCYDAKGKVGVKVRVMLDDSTGVASGYRLKVREVGVVRIMCYFQSPTDVCNDVPMSEPGAKGTWTSYGPRTGYPAGTIELFPDTPGSTDITPDLVLGNKPGLTQRLLLVK